MELQVFNYKLAERCRLDLHLSTSYVANYLGISEEELIQIEKGKNTPSQQIVESISLIYGYPFTHYFEPDKTALDELLEFQRQISAQVNKKERA